MRIIFFLIAIYSTAAVSAQDCKNFILLSKDAEFEMKLYDARGKESGKQHWKVDEVTEADGAISANVKSEYKDNRGEGPKATGVFKCNTSSYLADMRMLMPGDKMQSYKGMDLRGDPVYISYPLVLAVGQTLNNSELKLEAYNKNSLVFLITFNLDNRKVIGRESVTTPAGTYDAWKISYNSKFNTTVPNALRGIGFNFRVNEWFVPGFGIVKTETFNNNGKLLGTMLLSSVKK